MEHALFLIKPDGVEMGLRGILPRYLNMMGLSIVKERMLQLTPELVRAIYLRQTNEIVEYLTSAPVIALIVRGVHAVRKARLLKRELRRTFPSDEMRNLIHSTEPGNEYEIQVAGLFPDLVVEDFSLYADEVAYCFGQDTKSIQRSLTECEATCNASNLVLVCDGSEYDGVLEAARTSSPQRLRVYTAVRQRVQHNGDEWQIIVTDPRRLSGSPSRQLPLTELAEHVAPGCLLLGEVADPKLLNESVIRDFYTRGVRGLLCYHPRYALADTETLRGLAMNNGLFCVGGSAGVLPWGRNGVSREVFEALVEGGLGVPASLVELNAPM